MLGPIRMCRARFGIPRGGGRGRRVLRWGGLLGVASATLMGVAPALGASVPSPVDQQITAANGDVATPMVSSDGRYVVFQSEASNLVAGDTNGATDVFRFDRQTGRTVRVSVTSTGAQANGYSFLTAMSENGRWIGIVSGGDLTSDTPSGGGLYGYLVDAQTGTVTLMGDGYETIEGVTDDGQTLLIWTNQGFAVVNRATGTSTPIPSQGYPQAVLSADGSTVAFSTTVNPVTGTPNPVIGSGSSRSNSYSVWAYNLSTHKFTDASATDGLPTASPPGSSTDPAISSDGRYVAFDSYVSNLTPASPCIPQDPPTDNSCVNQVYVRDLTTGVISLASVGGTGIGNEGDSGAPSISGDGRYVTFLTRSATIDPTTTGGSVGAVVHDMVLGTTTRVGGPTTAANVEGVGAFDAVTISGDGQSVAYLYASLAGSIAGISTTYDLYETGNPSPGAVVG